MLSHASISICLVLLRYSTLLRIIVAGDDGGNLAATTTTTTVTASDHIDVRPIQLTAANDMDLDRRALNVSTLLLAGLSTGEALETLPMAQPLSGNVPPIELGKMPEFPQRQDAVYFIVAVSGGAKLWGRTLARTLIDMGAPFGSPQGPPLRPLYVDIPQNGRFSVKVLMSLCQQSEDQPLAGLIVIGDGHSARAIALAGSAMGLPVLWAKGGTANLDGMHREIPTPLQVMLQPSAKEILESIRALFLQTHWHSFFVLSDVGASMVMAGNEGAPLKEPPLVPTILPLSANSNDVFRQLAQISRSTRGVVLLLCDLEAARKIMAEAQNLNMVGGHFIWIWADTSSTTEFFEAYGLPINADDVTVALPPVVEDNNKEKPIETGARPADGNVAMKGAGKPDASARYHLDDWLERKLDFEDLNPFRSSGVGSGGSGHKKKNNERGGRQKSMPADRYIIGLNRGEGDDSDEFGATLSKRYRDSSASNRNSEESEHFFISNLNTDDNLDAILDSDGEEGVVTMAKPKRRLSKMSLPSETGPQTSTPKQYQQKQQQPHYNATQQHVLFHHFKDFPVGFLALRPVRMSVDRHFIRSAVRLFASTWAKVELEARDHTVRSMNRAKSKLNKWGEIVAPSPSSRRSGNGGTNGGGSTTSRRQRRRRRRREAQRKSNTNVKSLSSSQVNSKFLNSSDLTNSNMTRVNSSGSNDQILSGLNKQSNIKVNNYISINNNNNNNNNSKKSNNTKVTEAVGSGENDGEQQRNALNKRHNTWWSNENVWQTRDSDIRYQKGAPHYKGGCYGQPDTDNVWNAEYFASALKDACHLALSGQRLYDGTIEKSLTTHFELLNLVPDNSQKPIKSFYNQKQFDDGADNAQALDDENPTKWRRVGLVSGRNVHLDTIVWPGGDIVVSGLSARARSVFRVVTALAPPFVMESELDEDGLCLRGLPCHRLSTTGRHNLTLMFNAIETRDRLEEDAVEHGNEMPPEPDTADEKVAHITKCCYGLSMDILDNVATELGFEFHLYIVRDELFGAKYRNFKDWIHNTNGKDVKNDGHKSNIQHQSSGGVGSSQQQSNLRVDASSDRKSHSNANENGQHHQQQQQQLHHHHQHPKDSFNVYTNEEDQWNGIMGDLVSGSADMSFAPLSVSKSRAEVIDFTAPYFHSGVSLLAAPKTKSEIPLLAFLLPFSPELWIAIFTSLNITAVAVAVYEWLSPFGLNPWGRQRSKNFSMSSALWVMWGLLCGHLVAFKAPKSWPNKFLINVWGGFSVIFVASYTANIAALIAGLFFHNAANSYDASLFTQRVGAPIASAAEGYVQNNEHHLWEHMKKYQLPHIEDGIRGLKNGSLDLIMADSPVLDYYRATDHGCQLQRIGETFVDDSYAIGMAKGFPLKDSISALIAKYSSNGYLDILTEKWYGGLPCFKFEADIVQPRPLGVAAVAGVFLLLGMGMVMGIIILIFEHWFYKYALPSLRLKPKGTVWKSRNIMFFSQKLYRFINCVELVSPHHAARELVHSIRQGQIASLFQKSIKRKEDEQRRRRKSKAQFFEMIQEIRRVQQVEREAPKLGVVCEDTTSAESLKSPPTLKPKSSPRPRLFSALRRDGRSRSNSSVLSIRRFSTDSIFGERMDTIGRRLSRDITYSPPDLGRRFETFGKGVDDANKFDTFSGSKSNENICSGKYDTFSGAKTQHPLPSMPAKSKKQRNKRPSLNFESYQRDAPSTDDSSRTEERYELPVVKEGLEPPIYQEDRGKAVLKDKLHRELRAKYGPKVLIQMTAADDRPPLPKKMNAERLAKHQLPRHLSLDVGGANGTTAARPPVPSPRHNQRDLCAPQPLSILKTSPLAQPKQRPSAPPMNFGRLSREDLLRLSHSSQSEIHEYLNNSHDDRQAEPP